MQLVKNNKSEGIFEYKNIYGKCSWFDKNGLLVKVWGTMVFFFLFWLGMSVISVWFKDVHKKMYYVEACGKRPMKETYVSTFSGCLVNTLNHSIICSLITRFR